MLKGKIEKYPITLTIAEGWGYKDIKINNQIELIKLVVNEQNKYKDNGIKPLKAVMEDLNLVNTIMLIDERTVNLINEYSYYSNPATIGAPFDNKIWFDTVLMCRSYL